MCIRDRYFGSVGIAGERAGDGPHGGSIHFYGFLFDVLVGFEMSVRSAALDGLAVEGTIAGLGVAYRGARGIDVIALRLGCSRPGLVRVTSLRIGRLRPKRRTSKEIG